MSISNYAKFIIPALAASTLAACGSEQAGETVAATGPEPPIIEERQENFEAVGDAFKVIRTQLESGSPDTAAMVTAATDMNAAALKVEGHFPEGTSVEDGYDTEALPAIWEKPDEFAAATQMFVDRSAEMVKLTEAGDPAAVGAYVRDLGGSCKNCHDNFRLDTD